MRKLLLAAVLALPTPALAQVPPTEVGINLAGLANYANTRAFMNLAAGGTWQYINAAGVTSSLPSGTLDANSNLVKTGTNEWAVKQLSIPTAAFRGVSVPITCKWQGTATINVFGAPATALLRPSANSLTFTFVPSAQTTVALRITGVTTAAPVRNLDCRETAADPNALFDPTFLANVSKFRAVRFVKWMRAVEANTQVRWATRTKPGDGVIDGSDTVAVEYMVALANATGTNPWFNMPWNADDEYIRNFATYVRDNLSPGLRVYVEHSNEVWNYLYPVTTQASNEAKAAGWTGDAHQGMLRYYGKRAGQIMDIWASVFAAAPARLVRVASTQNSSWVAGEVLRPGDQWKKFDAVATAPYFEANIKAGQVPATNDGWFYTQLQTTLDTRFAEAKAVKTLGAGFGLRYVTYEAGQHVVSPDDLEQQARIQRDPRMGALYTRYLTRWQAEITDLTILFADYGKIDRYGAWGLQEYPGQALSEAPKAAATDAFIRSLTPAPPAKTKLDLALEALEQAVAAVREAAR